MGVCQCDNRGQCQCKVLDGCVCVCLCSCILVDLFSLNKRCNQRHLDWQIFSFTVYCIHGLGILFLCNSYFFLSEQCWDSYLCSLSPRILQSGPNQPLWLHRVFLFRAIQQMWPGSICLEKGTWMYIQTLYCNNPLIIYLINISLPRFLVTNIFTS